LVHFLSGVDTGANLTAATLEGANLDGANLTEANLYGASLRQVQMAGANLSRAVWTDGSVRADVSIGECTSR